VYCASATASKCRDRLGDAATVVDAGDSVELEKVLADLATRGIQRLMVEGGGTVHTQFLTQGLADELQLVIAPFFVGDTDAPRFVGAGTFPHYPGNRMKVAEVRLIGDVILARYLCHKTDQ
jgi:5-amino-6-(5-phosphoribosylamino)uracil reductase